ncbi:hypothetical protein V8F20_002669 [Naviculisporaceae sp. PSN 640]
MPAIAFQLRYLTPNNTSQVTNVTSDNRGGEYNRLPPQYISLLALFGGLFLVSILVIIIATRVGWPWSSNHQNGEPDLPSQHNNSNNYLRYREFRLQDPRICIPLNSVSPAIPFEKLGSRAGEDQNKSRPRQTRQAQRWSVLYVSTICSPIVQSVSYSAVISSIPSASTSGCSLMTTVAARSVGVVIYLRKPCQPRPDRHMSRGIPLSAHRL